MTQAALRAALKLGPDWTMQWAGDVPREAIVHLCGGLYGPDGAYVSEYLKLAFQPTGRPGLEVAFCERSREAWVRTTGISHAWH